jgi:hypothetical protein
MEMLLLTFVTGAVVPLVLWWLDRRAYAVRLRARVSWRGGDAASGLLELRVVNLSHRNVFLDRVEIRFIGDENYVMVEGVAGLGVGLAPGASQTTFLNPGTKKMHPLELQPKVRVLTQCDRIFKAVWIKGVTLD